MFQRVPGGSAPMRYLQLAEDLADMGVNRALAQE
jgi:hypothetical protein